MVTIEDRAIIDQTYFEIIGTNDFCITLRSRNTGHEWHLLERIANGCTTFVISHRHGSSGPYHLQRNMPTIESCLDYIKSHDAYHLEKIRGQKEQRLQRLGLLQIDGQTRHNNKKRSRK